MSMALSDAWFKMSSHFFSCNAPLAFSVTTLPSTADSTSNAYRAPPTSPGSSSCTPHPGNNSFPSCLPSFA